MRCNILPPFKILDQHLIAERRELRMIPPLLEKRVKSGKDIRSGIPFKYTLGSGHMLFWLDKMRYLSNRFDLLTEEMLNRGFKANLSLTFDMECAIMTGMDGDWVPSSGDFDVIITRLKEKIAKRPGWYRHYGKKIDANWVNETYNLR